MTTDEGRNDARADELDFDDDYQGMPAWPKVIGVISIVFGALGLICGGLGLASMFFLPGMMASAASNMQGGAPPIYPYAPAPPLMMALIGISLIWAIVLLAAGIMTASRNPVGRPAHLIWAVVAILLTIVSMYFQVQQQNELTQWMRDNPDSEIARATGGSNPGGVIGLALGAFFGFAWPIFIVIWFGAVKRRNSDIATGVGDVAA